jgi:hypothetical protein
MASRHEPRRRLQVYRLRTPERMKAEIAKEEINVVSAVWEPGTKKVVCDVENRGFSLVRVQEVRITGPHTSESTAEFPFLPAGRRHLELSWDEKQPPETLQLRFDRFTLKERLSLAANDFGSTTGGFCRLQQSVTPVTENVTPRMFPSWSVEFY